MIQDIAPKHLYNQFRTPEKTPEDIIFLFNKDWVLTKKDPDGTLAFPERQEFSQNFPTTYLFAIDDQNYYLGDVSHLRDRLHLPGGYQYEKMHSLRMTGPADVRMAVVTAHHLSVWYRGNQFCGRCGKPMHHSASERAMVCRSCGNIVYPKIAPAVIVGVINGDSILMTRYRGREYGGHALIAGFTEIGETAEETVAREVMEEAGVHVKNVRYYKNQPWGFSGDLLFGFFCDLDGSPEITMDPNELSVAEWVPRDAITEEDDGLSLTREMMLYFKNHPDC